MAGKVQELVLAMDWDILDASNGFSFDIGGSSIKLVYIANEDWVEPSKRKVGSKGKVRFVNTPRNELNKLFDFIRQNVKINRKSEKETVEIYSCGFGASEFAAEFKEKLNIKNHVLDESDCFGQGFVHLTKNYSIQEIIHPIYKPAFELIKLEIKANIERMAKIEVAGLSDSMRGQRKFEEFSFPQLDDSRLDKPLSAYSNFFPCGAMNCGSGFAFIMMQADGRSCLVDGSYRGGRMFNGLGSLLTGAKSFEELMELCAKGKNSNVSITQESIAKDIHKNAQSPEDDETATDMYKMCLEEQVLNDTVIFPYGKAVDKTIGDFNKEDLARCLLETHCLDLVQVTHYIARTEGLKHVFFSGGFVLYPLVRQIITVEWLRRDNAMRIYNPNNNDTVQAHFMLHGPSINAIGALLKNKLKLSENS